jgi:hypothetical protein
MGIKAHEYRNDFYKNRDKQPCLVCFFTFLLQAIQHTNFYAITQHVMTKNAVFYCFCQQFNIIPAKPTCDCEGLLSIL